MRLTAHAADLARYCGQIGKVGSGTKTAACADDDNHPHLVVRTKPCDRIGKGKQHGIGHGIALFSPINRDRGNAIGIDVRADMVRGHWAFSGLRPALIASVS